MLQNNKTIKMTDLEFYQKALSCQSWLVNRISESKAYAKNWSNEFCLKDIREAIEKYYSDEYVKEIFKIDNLTKERAKALRFCQWDEENPDLYLFPLWFVLFLPYGTKIIGIGGDTFEYSEEIDLDIRFGCVSFGVELKQ